MQYTRFAGLTVLDDGEPIRSDGSSFLVDNPNITAFFLKVGALTHRHDGAAALATPERPLDATAVGSGGQLPSDVSYSLTYTLDDARGGETLAAPSTTVATGSGLTAPAAPTVTPDYTHGIMPAGDYYYAKTLIDGLGGETPLGPMVKATLAAGHASGAVALGNLHAGVDGVSATGWRLWRSYEGGDWHLVLQGAADTYLDSGYDPPDNPARPPLSNSATGAWSITVTLPSADDEPALASATAINVYLSTTELFGNPSWYESYPVASAGRSITITDSTVGLGAPPHEPTAIGGAHQLDPDTELTFGLKSPVPNHAALPAGHFGDARVLLSTGELYAVLGSGGAASPGDWTALSGGGGGGGGASGGIKGVVATWADLPAGEYLDAYFVTDKGTLALAADEAGASGPGDYWEVYAPFSDDQGLIDPDTQVAFGWRTPRNSDVLTLPARFGDAIVTPDTHELWAVLNPLGASSADDWTLIGGGSGSVSTGGGELAYASGGTVAVGTGATTLLTLPAVASGATSPAVIEFHCPAIQIDNTTSYARVEVIDDLGTIITAQITPVNNVSGGWFCGNFNLSARVANPAGRTYTIRAITMQGGGQVHFLTWNDVNSAAQPMWASVR